MIDTHCHLTDERLTSQLDQVLQRAAEAGVSRMITVGTDLEDDAAALRLCHGRPHLRCSVGIHPNYSAQATVADVAKLRDLLNDPAVVALGEMGLDYHYTFAYRAHQAALFEAQLQVAAEQRRPVVIHCREAVADTLAILRNFPAVPAVFHCFTGSSEEASRIVEAGYYLGFTGVLTFKKNEDLRAAAAQTPLDRLLVETDAPYLAPEPLRKQKINEPALVVHTARLLAQLKNIPLESLDLQLADNVRRLFAWGP